MKDQTCCFTGHRRIPAGERAALEQRLEEEIENLIHQGVRYFGTGGALGYFISCSNASNSGVLKNSPRVISSPSQIFLTVATSGLLLLLPRML